MSDEFSHDIFLSLSAKDKPVVRDLTVDCARDGNFSSVTEVAAAVKTHLHELDLKPVRYTWKPHRADILAKIKRVHEARAAVELL